MSSKKVLCPIDFSSGSQHSIQAAIRIANEWNAELVLTHAWYVPAMAIGEFPDPAIYGIVKNEAQSALDAAKEAAISAGAKQVTSKLLSGVPGHEIVAEAQSDAAISLIVIGSHGRTGLARVLLGSTAEYVVRHAPCSVLTVRLDWVDKPYRHVLVPTDFSDCARDALELAAQLVQPGGAGVTLLHALELPVSYAGEMTSDELARTLDKRAEQLLEQWAAQLATNISVPITTRSPIGGAGAQILATLDNDDTYDLVVMGTHGRQGLRRLLGSVAEKTVRHAPCPVLVVRRRQ